MSAPLVIAHRGASAEQPENTLPAFRRALALRVDAIELDVQVARDGVPVVFHDSDLRRLTGTSGRISGKSWREIARLRVFGAEPIPRLVDVLRLTCGHVVVQIELKAGMPVAPVVRAVASARAERWAVFASFSPELVATAGRLAPAVSRMLISRGRKTPGSLVRQLATVGAAGVSVDHRAVRDAAWVRYFHVRGFTVWCWTVNDPRAMRRLDRLDVDGILTDNPALLRRTV